jgi:cytochrome c oxidase assembly protein subunit 15
VCSSDGDTCATANLRLFFLVPKMPVSKAATWLNRFAWITAFATLLLICSGGMVTSKGVGLAVPDWPTTFGYNMFLFPVSKWVGGILFEHTHRLIASAVGFLTIILAIWLWRSEHRHWVRNLGVLALLGVILQGILGGLRVTMLKDEIGIFHACVAQAFLALLVVIALVTTHFWQSLQAFAIVATKQSSGPDRGNLTALSSQVFRRLASIKMLAFAITIAIYVQLALGATMRHQHRDLSILDFPTANGAWIPDTSAPALAKINAWRDARGLSDVDAFQIWLQMIHRFVALLIGIGVIAFCSRVWKAARQIPPLTRLSLWWVAFLLVQVTLGAWTIWSNKAADIATAHVAVGAVMLSFGVSISAISWRISQLELGRARQCQSGSDPGTPHSEPVAA